MASQNLTQYERKRLENIRRNDEMMAALKVQSKATELAVAAKRQRPVTKSYKVSPQKRHKPETPLVMRRSLRIRGIPPDAKALDEDPVESPATFEKPLKESQPSARILGPISMRDCYSGEGYYFEFVQLMLSISKNSTSGALVKGDSDLIKEENYEFRSSLKFEYDEFHTVNMIKRESQEDGSSVNLEMNENNSDVTKRENVEVDDLKLETDGIYLNSIKKEDGEEASSVKLENDVYPWTSNEKMMNEDRSRVMLDSLALEPNNIARVVSGRIMVVRFFPCPDRRIILAANKFGDLCFWNVDKDDGEKGIYSYHPNPGPISGILVHPQSLSKVFTSCYEGFIRSMDVEKEVFNLMYSCDNSIYSLSQPSNDANCLYFGEGYGGLNIWDERTGKCQSEWILHENKINSIDFYPKVPSIMATSSTDGTVCIWDLRSMKAIKPKPLTVVKHKRTVQSAYFSPSGSLLASTSMDNSISISTGYNFMETFSIPHNNQTGRWISTFKGIWGWDDSYIFIGNMKRGVDVVSTVQQKTVRTLQSPDMSAIPCRFGAHPFEIGTIAGATSGGQVYMWTSR